MLYKIVFTIGVIVAVWKGFKLFETFRTKLSDEADDPAAQPRRKNRRTEGPAEPARPKAKTLDLIECPKCGAYVPNGTICPSIEDCTHKGRG